MKKYTIIGIIVLIGYLSACTKSTEEPTQQESEFIEITESQFQSEKMKIGNLDSIKFNKSIFFTGKIVPNIDGFAQISIPLPGIVNKIFVKSGQIVNEKDVLFELTSNEFIDLQKNFAESSAKLHKLKNDYERIKELTNLNINAKKEFLTAESEYKSELANYNSLKIKLTSIGINTSKVADGIFMEKYQIKSPISGYINNINLSLGQYIDNNAVVANVVNSKNLQLKMNVYEKDLSFVQIGQEVIYKLNNNTNTNYKAVIKSIEKSINNETNAINVFANFSDDNQNYFVNQYVEGKIITNPYFSLALPEGSLLKYDDEDFVLVLDRKENDVYFFKKIKVNIGGRNGNYVEIISPTNLKDILIEGAYNISIE